MTITSRAVYSSSLGRAEKYLNEVFGYQISEDEKLPVIAMNAIGELFVYVHFY